MIEETILKCHVSSLSETRKFASDIAANITSGITVLFYGDLGSGKTYLINRLVKVLGCSSGATSPSFSIINQYNCKFFVNHIDFYRIKNEQELFNLGLDDIFDTENVNLIEWPQIIEKNIYWNHFRIYIEFDKKNQTGRFIKFTKVTE